MSTLELISSRPARTDVEALVLAAACADEAPALVTDGAATDGLDLESLAAALPAVGFTGELDAVVRLPADVLGPDAAANCEIGRAHV